MMVLKTPILITIEYEDEIHKLTTFTSEYRSLMHLIFDKIYTDDFGDCKGVGRCGTCIVEILNNITIANQSDRNEAATLSKLEHSTPTSRLACQILIDEKINNLHCKIPKLNL